MTARRVFPVFLLVVLAFFAAPFAYAQVSLTALGTPIPTQTFDSLATSGAANAWADNSTLTGWYAQFTTTTNPTTYRADTGGSGTAGTGALYSYGIAGANPVTDRALGSVGSGTTGDIYWALRLVNNTGATITSLQISYAGEQWRQGACTPTPCTPAAQIVDFQYQVAAAGTITDANAPTTGWLDHNPLDFTSPSPGTSTAAGIDGNLAANRTSLSSTLAVTIAPGQEVWLRWRDINHANNDHGLAIDDVNVTPQGAGNAAVTPTCPPTLTTNFGTPTSTGVSATDPDGTVTSATITGITPSDPGTITLTGFTPAGGVGGTANATLNVSNTTPAGSYNVTIQWSNNDGSPQTANCVVAVTVNPPPTIVFIHQVQGATAATPMPGATVTVEGIVVGDYQASTQLSGFFLQEEDTDANAEGNPATSEGIFIFCNTCPTAVAEGQRVQVTGVVSEFNNMTEITASTAGSVVITNAGNNLAQVTPATIDLPVVGVVNDFYEAREGMLVTFIDTLSISEYFELFRFGHIELYEGGRPRQYTEFNPPSAAGYTTYQAALDRRRVILDDDDNQQNVPLTLPDGSQFVYHPRANGGFSVGTQGTDFFRGGDVITGLTGVLHWSFPGVAPDTWRIRPTSATASSFTVANPRPVTPPAVGGAIKALSMNTLNYFTTIDTTSSSSSGPCGPSGTQDCRGADSVAELNRQRERASIVICGLNPDVAGLMEVENNTATTTITDLLGSVNARGGGANPYTFVNTGGTLGTDAIRNFLIYRTNILSPVGSPLVDLDPVHNRPPTAQTFDVTAPTNPAFGQRFTIIANHFKSKGCPGTGADADAGDGQSCFNGTRTAQANRLLTWINSTVLPAAGDPDVILVGDFNAYAQENPITTIVAGGYTDTETALLGANAYSYLFDGQLGHLDYAFTSASLTPQVTGVGAWHINADEVPLFDYNDEVADTGEQAFEEKPDGSALVPPRVVFQPSSPYRASDHDPVLLGIFAISDLSLTKTDSIDPVNAGQNFFYTVTIDNAGPDPADNVSWSDALPAGTTFVSLSQPGGWLCTTPAVGANGTVTCSIGSVAVGSAAFNITVAVNAGLASGTVLSNTATVTSTTSDSNGANNSDTETTTVATSADLQLSKTDSPDPVNAGSNLSYQFSLTNNGPSNASATFTDTLPAGTTFVSLSTTGPWTCTTPAVGATGTVTCNNTNFLVTADFFTLVVKVDANVATGTVLSNTATLSSATPDTNGANNSATATTTVAGSADLSITKTDTPDPVNAGNQITYTVTVTNAGPSNATSVTLTDTTPPGTTFAFLAAPGAWVCPVPPAGGPVVCTHASLPVGTSVFTIKVIVDPSTAAGTVLTNTAALTAATSDPNPGNESASATTTVATSADLLLSKTDTPDPVNAGSNLSYQLTLTNNGPSNATTATFTDTLPPDTTFVSLSTTGSWTCTTPGVGSTGTVTCNNPSFGVTADFFTLVVNVGQYVPAGTVLSNTATLSSATPDPNGANNSNTATTMVAAAADMRITKVDTPDPVTAGNNLTYTINIANTGPSDAVGVTFTDTIPANTTFVSLTTFADFTCTTPAVGGTGSISCSKPSNFLAGSSGNFILVVNVNGATASGTVITNTANIASTTTETNGANNSATATTTVGVGSADVSVTKTDSPDPVDAGSNLTYTITVTNAGPSTATTVALADTLPAGTTFVSLAAPGGWTCSTPAVGATGTINCSIPTLGVTSAIFTAVVHVDPALLAGNVLSNTATVSTATTDPNGANNSATATTTVVASADLLLSKTDTPDPVNAGSNISYQITLTNNGPSNAASASFSDTLPAGTTFVSISTTGPWTCTTPAVGATGTVTCTNPSFGVTVDFFTIVVQTNAGLAAGTVLTNTATVTSTTIDPNGANNSSTATTTVGVGSADVSITKVDTPDPVNAGTNITYTITVANAGPTNAASASMSDTLPAGTTFVSLSAPAGWTCTTPAVGAGGTVSCTNPSLGTGNAVFSLVVRVAPATAPGTVITNTATVSSTTADPNGANNSSTATTTVGVGSADVSVAKVDTPDPVNAGANLTYTITVANAGPTNAASTSMSDPLPAGTTFVSLSAPAGWTCTTPAVGAAGTVSCTNPSLGTGNAVFSLVVRVSPATAPGTVITNTATVSSTTADPSPGNESATATTTVAASPANVSGTKTVTGTFAPGGSITYTIVLTNNGASTQQDNPGDEFADVLPASLTLVSASSTSGTATATPATRTVTWNGPIAAGASVTITINATVRSDAAPGTTVTNQGTINYDADGNGTNESTRQTDSPAAPGSADATTFTVITAPAEFAPIPTLDELALLALAALLAAVAAFVLKR
jgi:uncharacterized repeat protein (TIGR01451 family)